LGTPVILALGRLRQEDNEFEASQSHTVSSSLGYVARACLQKKKKIELIIVFIS
jgi:hypothetical protein